LSEENGVSGNNYGFGFGLVGAATNQEFGMAVGIGQGELDGESQVLTTSIDTSQFHTYSIVGSFASGFALLVDGVEVTDDLPIYWDSPVNSPVPGDTVDLVFGDLSGLTNASVDITNLNITQIVPEPPALLLFVGSLLALVRFRRGLARTR
jgi:hypothetical protein